MQLTLAEVRRIMASVRLGKKAVRDLAFQDWRERGAWIVDWTCDAGVISRGIFLIVLLRESLNMPEPIAIDIKGRIDFLLQNEATRLKQHIAGLVD